MAPKTINPLVSIVIPSKNESSDIANTLKACIEIDYEPKEIIVVDDSTDNTPEIISKFTSNNVCLIHRDENKNGCCGARTRGMQLAKGEIIILLNADNLPKPDFIRNLLSHYSAGADYVVVRSQILNREQIWGKFTDAEGKYRLTKHFNIEWCEGFSCRKAAAHQVGYFPGDFPVPFCRDWMLGSNLNKAGFKKHVDLAIVMEHVWPSSLNEYWRNQVHRGCHSSPTSFYFKNMSVPLVLIKECLKAGLTAMTYFTILPVAWHLIKISRFSSNGLKDVPSLFFAKVVNDLATTIGNFKGWYRIFTAKGLRTRSNCH